MLRVHRLDHLDAAISERIEKPVGSTPGGVSDVPASPGVTTGTTPAVVSKPPTVKAWGAGTYKVGDDITAGSYKTSGAPSGCYWERLKNDSGKFDAILANDNLGDCAPGRVTIKSTDKFVKFSGDCQWIKA